MAKGVREVVPNGNKAVETENRRKIALDNIKKNKTAEQLLKENPPSKKLEKEIDKAENKSKPKNNLPRDDIKDLEAFVKHCVQELDVKLVMVPVSNKTINEEWTLEHNKKRIAWICPRASMLFGVYLFLKDERQIIKVYTKDDMDDVFSKIKTRCEELDKEPIKPKTSKKEKGRQMSVIEKLEEKEKKARSYKDSNGFSLGNIKATPEVVAWVESKGYTLQSKSIKW